MNILICELLELQFQNINIYTNIPVINCLQFIMAQILI